MCPKNKRKHNAIQASSTPVVVATTTATGTSLFNNNTCKSLKTKRCKVANRSINSCSPSCSHSNSCSPSCRPSHVQQQQVEQQVLGQQQQVLGQQQQQQQIADHTKEPSLLNQQALVKFQLGEFDEAESLLKQALILSNTLSHFCQSSKKESSSSSNTNSNNHDECNCNTNNVSITNTTIITNSNVSSSTMVPNLACNHTTSTCTSMNTTESTIGTILKLHHHPPKQEYDEGMNLFSSPIELNTIWDSTLKSAAIQYNLGQTYIKRCNFLVGIDWFRSAMRTCTEINNPSWHHNNVIIVFKIIDAVAYCYYRKELYDDAIKFYEVAEHYTSNSKLGSIYIASVKNSLAVVLFRKEATCSPTPPATTISTHTSNTSNTVSSDSSTATSIIEEQSNTQPPQSQQQQVQQQQQQQSLTTKATSDSVTETKRRAISLLNESLTLYKCLNDNSVSVDSCETSTTNTSTYNRTATVYNNLGRVYYLSSDYHQALVYFESALKIRRKFFGTNSIDLAVTICNLGQTYHQLDQLDDAMIYFDEFLSIARGSMDNNSDINNNTTTSTSTRASTTSSTTTSDSSFVTHRDLSIVLSSVASIHLGRNQLNDAKKMYEMALNSSRLAYGTAHAEVAHILNKLGSVCYKIRQFDIALTYLQEGLHIEKLLYGKHHPNVIVTCMNLAQIYRDQNLYENAFVHYNHAHAATAATKGSDSIAVSDTLLSMGLMLYRMKAFSSSFDFYQEALYVQRKHYGEETNHAAVASTLNSIAIVLFHLGQARLAITYFEESLKMRRQMFGPYHPDIAVNLFNLAKLHLELHDNETASELYKETLKVERAIQGPLSKEVLQTLQLLGLLHQHNGELPIALEYFTEALELERQRTAEGTTTAGTSSSSSSSNTKSVFTAKLLNLIGNIHLQRGNAKDMMKCFIEASRICEGNLYSIAVAGYNFYSLSKLHPECAEVA